jgi:hypothetical protein
VSWRSEADGGQSDAINKGFQDVDCDIMAYLDMFVIAMAPSFSFSHSVWFKDQIAIDDNSHWETRPDGQGRLHVEVTPDDLLAGMIERIPCSTPKRLEDCTVTFAGARAELGPDAKQGRQQPRLE